MTPEEIIKKILSDTQSAVDKFQKSIPGIQNKVLDQVNTALKDLDLKDGNILNNVKNLKLINSLRNGIERIIVSEGYKADVKDFISSFDGVEALNQAYFASFNQKFEPNKTLPIIKKAAIDRTLNDLMRQGLQTNVIDKIGNILNQNTTSGGSYASLTEQLRNNIINDSTGEGSMLKYAKTIATDSINQYSAQYHDTLAQDLNLNWGRYIGSNITTTREFCEKLTEKEWVHRSELPKILEGEIDGHQCKVNKAGLPLGMIPGTDVSNFKIRRGGYNCGHQFFWVPDSAVPAELRNKFEKTVAPKKPEETQEPVPTPQPSPAPAPAAVPPPEPVEPIYKQADAIIEKNKAAFNGINEKKLVVYKDLIDQLSDTIKFESANARGSYFAPLEKKIVFGNSPDRQESDYYRATIMSHEVGHAIHFEKEIITLNKVDADFKKHFDGLKKTIKGKGKDIQNALLEKFRANRENRNNQEQIGTLMDILGSLTKGLYGGGHSKAYYKQGNYAMFEVFAHGVSLSKVKNDFIDITPEMKEVVDAMIEYSKGVL